MSDELDVIQQLINLNGDTIDTVNRLIEKVKLLEQKIIILEKDNKSNKIRIAQLEHYHE